MSSHTPHDPAIPRACRNCGAPLSGPYCSQCGQHDVDYHHSFHYLLHDLLENLFHFEGKFFVTVAWLLAKPGRLTREFLAGRRQRQLNPLRFYLFVSVLFFLGLTLLNHGHVFDFDRRQADELTTDVEAAVRAAQTRHPGLTPEQANELARQINRLIGQTHRQPDRKIVDDLVAHLPAKTSSPAVELATTEGRNSAHITIDRSSAIGRALAEKLGSGELKASTIVDELEHRVPTLLFLGVPLFALLLKLVYFRARRLFIEHLIFSLHLHTWFFLTVMVSDGYLKLAALAGRWPALVVGLALFVWVIWYLVASFRAIYGQSRLRTSFKLLLLAGLYALLLAFVAALLATAMIYWITLE